MSKDDWQKGAGGGQGTSPSDRDTGQGPADRHDRNDARGGAGDGAPEAHQQAPQPHDAGESHGTTPRTLEKALDQIDLLRDQLAAKTEEAAQTQDRLLRERAELENFKRRMHRDKSEALRYACEPLLRELLPVIDNLERAIAAASTSESTSASVEGLVSGVRMVLQHFLEVLDRFGVTRIKAVGQPFDPSQHEAVAQVESDAPPGSVVKEYAPGYRLHDRLLRAAQVAVAKAPSKH